MAKLDNRKMAKLDNRKMAKLDISKMLTTKDNDEQDHLSQSNFLNSPLSNPYSYF